MSQLPAHRQRHSKYDAFMTRLIRQAEKAPTPQDAWLPWPNQKRLAKRTRNEYTNRLNNGEFFGPGFEGCVRNGWLYARYVGTQQAV